MKPWALRLLLAAALLIFGIIQFIPADAPAPGDVSTPASGQDADAR